MLRVGDQLPMGAEARVDDLALGWGLSSGWMLLVRPCLRLSADFDARLSCGRRIYGGPESRERP
jgi:hypothetical protein